MMNEDLKACLAQVRLQTPVCWSNIALVPLIVEDGEPAYVTMAEAMRRGEVRIMEVSETGSVPELKVIHTGSEPVLLLDGEEIQGAKQNRVVNTSILIAAFSELVIPVSCTEQGRWHHVSAEFSDSHVVLERKIRARKSAAVSDSLGRKAGFSGNQGELWSGINELHADLGSVSPTMAMNDAYRARADQLNQGLEALQPVEGQHGFIAVIDGRAVGMDLLSRGDAYSTLHTRLVKSCLIDAISRRQPETIAPDRAAAEAENFLAVLREARTEDHPSPGLGTDIRIHGLHMVGSALSHEKTALHVACFRLDERLGDYPGHISSMNRRRGMHRRETGWPAGD